MAPYPYILSILLIHLLNPFSAVADVPGQLKQLLQGQGSVGVVVMDRASGQSLFVHNPDVALKPASLMKLVTSAAALRELGPEYRFRTEVWARGMQGTRAAEVGIKGFGDPSLNLEQGWLLARGIRRTGIRTIERLLLDDSAYDGIQTRAGQRAYQAQATALALNFNAIAVEICPTPHRDARVVVEPWESAAAVVGRIETVIDGATYFAVEELPSADRLSFSLGGAINAQEACRTVFRSVSDPLGFFGDVVGAYLTGLGVKALAVEAGRIASDFAFLFQHQSKPLREIVMDLNHFSNNFTAEQILFHLGGDADGQDLLNRQRGLSRMERYLAGLNGAKDAIRLVDASGLSHDNRLTATLLAAVLADMAADRDLAIEYKASLPVAGRSGTMQNRSYHTQATVRAKTGRLAGVTALAGYMDTISGRELIFVVLQNGNRDPLRLEKQLVETIGLF